MLPPQTMLVYTGRMRPLAVTLSSICISIKDDEMSMAARNGLPARFANLISALDALGYEGGRALSFSFVKRHRRREEQRNYLRTSTSVTPRAKYALLSAHRAYTSSVRCPVGDDWQRAGHTTEGCFKTFPHMRSAERSPTFGPSAVVVPSAHHVSQDAN